MNTGTHEWQPGPSDSGTQPVGVASGKVYIVGAGPGDPALMTLRGLSCLQKADVVIVDRLVHPRLLEYLRPGTQVVCLGDDPDFSFVDEMTTSLAASLSVKVLGRAEAVKEMVTAAQAGKVVLRLKAGCPEVFAGHTDELEALRKGNIPYEIVPGIPPELAAAAYAEIALTDVETSSAVVLAVANDRPAKQGVPVDFRQLGQFSGTVVVYMGEAIVTEWAWELLRGGLAPSTPVAIVCRAGWPDQQLIRCRLGDLASTVRSHHVRGPAVVVIGQCVDRMPSRSWFENRPLFGRRILVTRPEEEGDQLVALLAELGAEVLSCPAIKISEPPDWTPVDQAIEELDGYDWIVFTSVNGVRYFLGRLRQKGRDGRSFGKVRIAAIGPGTARELERHFLRADLVPSQYRSEVLGQELAGVLARLPNRPRVLLVRASRGRPVLAEILSSSGAVVHQIAVYTSEDVTHPDPHVVQAFEAQRIHWVTITSSSIARSVVRMFGEKLRTAKLASISPVTSGTLRELGFEPTAEARQYTIPGLVAAILEWEARGQS
ncbi:MAG: uroporphyrinogen-III synthase [Thermoguttaceae bacterium]|nr:uroporphyrinogen-III synthase [Thermoguttaceae bacterium]MDW8079148.1 uroporphyrinogen-III synthase [Thermoguttaceae bacterium]